MSRRTLYVSVTFLPCGAELHPAYESRVTYDEDTGRYWLDFPLHLGYMLYSRKAQMAWGLEMYKHIRSWAGGKPQILHWTPAVVRDDGETLVDPHYTVVLAGRK